MRWYLGRGGWRRGWWIAAHHHGDPVCGVQVYPDRDLIDHDLDGIDCICGPKVEWGDEGGTYPNGPLVTHHALDGRERMELDREG